LTHVSDHGKTKKVTRTRQTVPKASRSRPKTPNSGPKAKARESSPRNRQTQALRSKKSQQSSDPATSILEKTIPVNASVPVDSKYLTISKKKNKKNKGPTFLTACIDKLVQHSLAKILSLSKP